MIAPCTKLDQTVNQIRLLCAIGSREAIIKNTPSVAYTPKIISRYSERPPACHAQPEGQTIVNDQMPNINISPTTTKATRRYLIRSDSVMFLPLLAIQLTYWTSLMPSIDDSMKAESREIPFTRKCNVMRVKNSALFEIAVVLVRLDHSAAAS
jgi:hypothetical protein